MFGLCYQYSSCNNRHNISRYHKAHGSTTLNTQMFACIHSQQKIFLFPGPCLLFPGLKWVTICTAAGFRLYSIFSVKYKLSKLKNSWVTLRGAEIISSVSYMMLSLYQCLGIEPAFYYVCLQCWLRTVLRVDLKLWSRMICWIELNYILRN